MFIPEVLSTSQSPGSARNLTFDPEEQYRFKHILLPTNLQIPGLRCNLVLGRMITRSRPMFRSVEKAVTIFVFYVTKAVSIIYMKVNLHVNLLSHKLFRLTGNLSNAKKHVLQVICVHQTITWRKQHVTRNRSYLIENSIFPSHIHTMCAIPHLCPTCLLHRML